MTDLGRSRLLHTFSLLGLVLLVVGCSSERVPTTLPPAHSASWQDTLSADFHGKVVAQSGTPSCQTCHGADFRGGEVGVSCIDCHLGTAGACISCHGGADNTTGAPPTGLRGEIDDTTRAVGAHTVHLTGASLSSGFACDVCHRVPPFLFDSLHLDLGAPALDSIAEITWSGLATAPGNNWDRATATCSGTYCHGNFGGGDGANAPVWNAAGQANCGSCHDVGSAPATLGWKHEFHVGTAGLDCADCHAQMVDAGLTITALDLHVNGLIDTLTRDTVLCNTCHGSGTSSCTLCHGGTDNQSGAPPVGLRGETATSALAVGAHTTHMAGGLVADGFACTECHLIPTGVFDAGHLGADSVAELTWGPLANASGISWSRGTATCDNTYCHGNFSAGDGTNSPVWTGANQAQCGSCHDVGSAPATLGWKHQYHVGIAGLGCVECHYNVVDSNLTIVGRPLHVNGTDDTLIRNFTGTCLTCHGSGSTVCTICHGGTDNQSGAPPVGLGGETATSALAVGAHTVHLEGGAIADAFNCSECHVRPDSLLQSGHLGADSIAEISWGTLASAPGISWTRGTATCADTYCHGNFNGGDGNNAPVWTASNQATCGSCHDVGSRPQDLSGEHDKHVDDKGVECYQCHDSVVDSGLNIVGPDQHVDGSPDVVFSSGQGNFDGRSCTGVGCHGREDW